MKIVLVGAGSAQFGCGILGDIFCSKRLVGSEITLHDINPATLGKVLETAKSFIAERGLDYRVNATTDRKAAFKGASFIVSSIEVGNRFELWDEDWKIPLQYGARQVYGENGGPGGVFHALRIIPPILEIVADAMEICPEAYIFNFSNPMTAIVTTVKRAYPQARFIGICHEIGWLARWLPRMLGKPLGELKYRAAGLNHFSCMLEITDAKTGKDLYPEVRQKAPAFFEREPGYSDLLDRYKATGIIDETERFDKGGDESISAYLWADRRIARFMLENYGLLPITTDSHFGEYLGWAWDVADHRGILDFYDYYRITLSQATRYEIRLETIERVVPIIDGIIGNEGFEEGAVNVINDGLLPDLPSWIAVEVPATVGAAGVAGVPAMDVPKGFLSLLRSYSGVYDLTAEAILRKRKDLVIQAMLASPVMHQATTVAPMVDRMISRQERWLGYLK